MALFVDDITYVYEKGTAMSVNALNHITVEIPDGQFIGLVGHTGSGKSTFVQMLNGLLAPTTGRILWNGQDIHEDGFDKKPLRAAVGLVFQYPEHQLFEADVLSDVKFGPRNLGLSEEECEKRAEEALLATGLPKEFWKASPFDLSGGQQRRAAIAGVLAMHPEVLILDEPTAGLDPKGRDEILDMVRDMKNHRKMTILLVSHSMDDVANYADRILVMNAGAIMMDGTPREVFERYRELEPIGLSAPQTVYILEYLKEHGLPVATDRLTVDEAAAEILRARKQRNV
ncbi:energy-coupling factor transport system ATP-binding protein [Lachnospiraceae bacterium NK3A20]|nr:energy-coupling factor transport system ATP-binding protein [Lachnospiraceae bacterium NK3A20]